MSRLDTTELQNYILITKQTIRQRSICGQLAVLLLNFSTSKFLFKLILTMSTSKASSEFWEFLLKTFVQKYEIKNSCAT